MRKASGPKGSDVAAGSGAFAAGNAADAPPGGHRSLEGVHGSVELPHHEAGFWEQWRAFVGPAVLVSVGYMDPGNWGTDLAAGAQFKYGLLWVVGMASFMAIFMQIMSARLGVVTGKDLAQACRDWAPRWTRWPNWLLSEVAERPSVRRSVLVPMARPRNSPSPSPTNGRAREWEPPSSISFSRPLGMPSFGDWRLGCRPTTPG